MTQTKENQTSCQQVKDCRTCKEIYEIYYERGIKQEIKGYRLLSQGVFRCRINEQLVIPPSFKKCRYYKAS